MKKRNIVLWFLSPLLAVANYSTACADEGRQKSEPMETQDALVSEALSQNLEVKFYEAEIAAARAGRKTAGAIANPELSSSMGQKTVSGIDAEGAAWAVSLTQPFEWPGRLGLRKAIANYDIELAELGLHRFRAALASRIRGLANALFSAQEKSRAAQEVAERFRTLREILVQRDPAGLTPLLETRVIEATELAMWRRASEATLLSQSALLELNQLRGAASGAPLLVATGDYTFREAAELGTSHRTRSNQ